MTVSFAQPATLACPACSASFDADIWLIVATNERPDLIERIRAGALHTVTCPRCGHAGNLDAPLLLFRPDADPPILFSPAQGTTSEQDQQQAAVLVGLLRERLGSAWREAWLAQGLRGVQREMLPVALAEDLATASHGARNQQVQRGHDEHAGRQRWKWLEQMQRALDKLRKHDPETPGRPLAGPGQAIETSGGGGSGPPVPAIFTSWLATALQAEQQFLQTNDLTALTMAVETWNQILDHPGFRTAPPNFRLAVLNNAGVVFLRRYLGAWAH
ncbi:MAG: CpXC domain-containing protein [Chloroflexaceae bacterium]|nr:CpXC domain-containing protein [Chloroflexaceae bacterium]